MMIHADYIFYVEKYGGTVIPDEDSFKQPVSEAEMYLKQVVRKEPDENDVEVVKMCLCKLSDLLYRDEMRINVETGRVIHSENTDGYSVTYESEMPLEKRIYGIIRRYLSGTGLLYAGVRKCADKCRYHDL